MLSHHGLSVARHPLPILASANPAYRSHLPEFVRVKPIPFAVIGALRSLCISPITTGTEPIVAWTSRPQSSGHGAKHADRL